MRKPWLALFFVLLFLLGCEPPKKGTQSQATQEEKPIFWAGDDLEPGESTAISPGHTGVTLSRMCSDARSATEALFFEEAEHPLLVFEAWHAAERKPKPKGKPGRRVSDPLDADDLRHDWKYLETVAAVPLSDVKLHQGRHFREVPLDEALDKFRKGLDSKIDADRVHVLVKVCEDAQGKGNCRSADYAEELSLDLYATPFPLMKRAPRAIKLHVFSGRNMNRHGHPERCDLQYSPIVLDLDGKGIRLSAPERGVEFDLNDTGSPIVTGWLATTGNAFLAMDRNGNGSIDSGAELFGSATRLRDGSRASNGYEALAELDADGDREVTPADPAWAELRLWIDDNFDGVSDDGDLVALEEYGIEALAVEFEAISEVDRHGNEARQRSSFRMREGGETVRRTSVDIWFRTLAGE